ncbi:MAG: hypothetical protein H6924_03970 [Alphaproteobacteria bacterium]|nr:hypothetical protein [Alphaproteobacteria bacterium]
MIRCALLVVALLAAAPAHAAQSYMVGSWFGRGQPGDRLSMYIDRMQPDGSWRGEYRTCVRGKPIDQVQTGRWELDGDTLLLHVQSVDGKAMPRTDHYRMISHDARGQKYVSLPSNFAYTPRHVDDGYTMPPCDLIS